VLRDKQRAAERGPQRRLRRPTATRRHEEAILKDIVELADCYDTPIRTALRLSIPHPRPAFTLSVNLTRARPPITLIPASPIARQSG
jgi:hypothetical protein